MSAHALISVVTAAPSMSPQLPLAATYANSLDGVESSQSSCGAYLAKADSGPVTERGLTTEGGICSCYAKGRAIAP